MPKETERCKTMILNPMLHKMLSNQKWLVMFSALLRMFMGSRARTTFNEIETMPSIELPMNE